MSQDAPPNKFSREDSARRHFDTDEYKEIARLMTRIGQGDAAAQNQFLKKIDGVAKDHAVRIARQVWGDALDDALAMDVLQEVLIRMVVENPNNPKYYSGKGNAWSKFNMDLQNDLRDHYTSMLHKTRAEENGLNRLEAAVSESPNYVVDRASIVQLNGEQMQAARDVQKVTSHRDPLYEASFNVGRTRAIEAALGRLNPLQRAVLEAQADGLTDVETGQRLVKEKLMNSDRPDGYAAEIVRQTRTKVVRYLKGCDVSRGGRLLNAHLDPEDMRYTGSNKDFSR